MSIVSYCVLRLLRFTCHTKWGPHSIGSCFLYHVHLILCMTFYVQCRPTLPPPRSKKSLSTHQQGHSKATAERRQFDHGRCQGHPTGKKTRPSTTFYFFRAHWQGGAHHFDHLHRRGQPTQNSPRPCKNCKHTNKPLLDAYPRGLNEQGDAASPLCGVRLPSQEYTTCFSKSP